MTTKKTIRIDYGNNPSLAEIMSRKEIGETCELKLSIQLDERGKDYASGSILEIEADDYGGGDDEGSVTPTGEEPVSVVAKT